MSTPVNPYINMPLPLNVRLNLGFTPKPAASKVEEKLQKEEAVREVNRALNALAYAE